MNEHKVVKRRDLTPQQYRAIQALLTCRTQADAAEQAGVAQRTLQRWLDDVGFRAALDQAATTALEIATSRLSGLVARTVSILDVAMSDEEASLSVRLRAADIVLSRLLQMREIQVIERRLSALEATYAEMSE